MSAQNSQRSATPASWKPGQSGNPGGRRKLTPQEFELRKACEDLTPEALKTIVYLMLNADKDSVRLAAATLIVERAHGKSVEHKEIRSGPLDDATTAELLEMKRMLRLPQVQEEGPIEHEHYCI